MVNSRKVRHQNKRQKKGGCLKGLLLLMLVVIVVIGLVFGKLYLDARSVTKEVYVEKTPEQSVLREETINTNEAEPLSILLLGVDTGEEGRTDQGRSDVMMVVTLNPSLQKTTITSIPRDTLTEIVGYGQEDKINHAYAFGGTAMSINTVQHLLDIPIDYSITVDMKGFAEIIDAVGGVTLAPLQTFNQSGYSFTEGVQTVMDGEMALAYTRNRYDTDGDYGRQERQRQLIQAIAEKALSLNIISQYQEIIASFGGNVKTDMPFTTIMSIAQNYSKSLNNVETVQLTGNSEMIDGIYYEKIDPQILKQIQQQLKQQLEIDE